MENLTVEQALNNIQVVLENFVGKKQDHIALEQSFLLIKKELTPKELTVEKD